MRALRRTFAVGLLLGAAACETGPVRVSGAVDPEVYRTCDDPEGRELWQRAQEALAAGDDAAALRAVAACVARCPSLVRAHIAYQDLARRLGGEAEQAMIARYTGEPDGSGSPVPAYFRARLAETAYGQANALDKLLQEHPSFAWGHLSRARVLRGQGRLTEALRAYETATVYDGQLPEPRLERAQILNELGRYQEAATGYAAYLQLRPDDLDATRDYVTLLVYRLGRLDEALVRLNALEAAGDRSPELRMDRAALLWRAGRHEAAAELYLGVLREQPENARAALDLGLLYYEVVPQDDAARRRYWPKARAAFRRFLAHTEPSDGHEHFERTWAVPYRLRRIDSLLGPAAEDGPAPLDALRWMDG